MRERHRAAEEIVDGLLGRLADDVPQRLLDPGGGAIELQRAAPLRVVVERHLQDVTDLEWIAPDQIAAELLDLSGDGAVAVVLAVGFAPPDHAGIGLDAHKDEVLAPAGMHRKAFDAGDFHRHPITSLRLQGSTPMLIERPIPAPAQPGYAGHAAGAVVVACGFRSMLCSTGAVVFSVRGLKDPSWR